MGRRDSSAASPGRAYRAARCSWRPRERRALSRAGFDERHKNTQSDTAPCEDVAQGQSRAHQTGLHGWGPRFAREPQRSVRSDEVVMATGVGGCVAGANDGGQVAQREGSRRSRRLHQAIHIRGKSRARQSAVASRRGSWKRGSHEVLASHPQSPDTTVFTYSCRQRRSTQRRPRRQGISATTEAVATTGLTPRPMPKPYDGRGGCRAGADTFGQSGQ